jgi:hypothetical protein
MALTRTIGFALQEFGQVKVQYSEELHDLLLSGASTELKEAFADFGLETYAKCAALVRSTSLTWSTLEVFVCELHQLIAAYHQMYCMQATR